MKTFSRIVLGSGIVIAALVGTAHAQEADLKYRSSVMKAVGGHASALGQLGKGEVPHVAHMQGHADALVALSSQVLDAFRNKAMGEKSRAKEEIWTDWSGFEAKARDFQTASMAVAEAARSGDAGQVGGKLDALFDTCKGCHKDYRAPEKK